MQAKKQFGISFGPLMSPISTQIQEMGYKFDRKKVMTFEEQRNAIHTLQFGGLLAASVVDSCYKKLYKKIEAHVCKENKLKKVK